MFCQRENHSSQMIDQHVNTTRCSIDNFAEIIEANFLCRDECVVLRCTDRQSYQRCEVECEIPTRENSLHLRSRCMHLNVFQHDFQPRHASTTLEEAMGPQSNEKKLITRSQVDPVAASCHCLKQASSLCCGTMRSCRWSWINEKSNNSAPPPMWAGCAVGNRCNPSDNKCANTVLLET